MFFFFPHHIVAALYLKRIPICCSSILSCRLLLIVEATIVLLCGQLVKGFILLFGSDTFFKGNIGYEDRN